MSTPSVTRRADLHVHSSHSDASLHRGIRAVGSAESYTDPLDLYAAARARGMDFVTISDHNSLEGALAIAHLPGTFLSVEFDTWFPENGCRVHVVASGIDEATFQTALTARESIYDLVACLREAEVVHYLAHPLMDMTGLLDIDTVEKLLLLFEVLEGRNGARTERCNGLLRAIVASLTPELVEDMAERQGLEPYGREPWRKTLVGGSDDHSGLFVADAYTVADVDAAGDNSVAGFLAAVATGRCAPTGDEGDSRLLAHTIYASAFWRIREILGLDDAQPRRGVIKMVTRGFGRIGRDVPVLEKTVRGVRSMAPGLFREGDPRGPAWEATLQREIGDLLAGPSGIDAVDARELNRRLFAVGRQLANDVQGMHMQTLLDASRRLTRKERLQSGFAVGMVNFLEIPYYIAWNLQTRDRAAQRRLREYFLLGDRSEAPGERIAVLTDSVADSPAVDLALATLTGGRGTPASEIEVITSLADPRGRRGDTDFPPLAWRPAVNGGDPFVWPPLVEIVDYLDENGFTGVHACTPGPMGLLAVIAAWLLHVPATASTPRAPRPASSREARYLQWFYGRFGQVTAGSRTAARGLVAGGLDPDRAAVAPTLMTRAGTGG